MEQYNEKKTAQSQVDGFKGSHSTTCKRHGCREKSGTFYMKGGVADPNRVDTSEDYMPQGSHIRVKSDAHRFRGRIKTEAPSNSSSRKLSRSGSPASRRYVPTAGAKVSGFMSKRSSIPIHG